MKTRMGTTSQIETRSKSMFPTKVRTFCRTTTRTWCTILVIFHCCFTLQFCCHSWTFVPSYYNNWRIRQHSLFTATLDHRTNSRLWDAPRSFEYNDNYDDNNDDDDDDDDIDDDIDDLPPNVDISQFKAPTASFGWNKGRSSPSQRKAMGKSDKSMARIHICSNCGSEFVKWMGKCPTCQEWNTLQEHAVVRASTSSSSSSLSSSLSSFAFGGRPIFEGAKTRPSSSWLDGLDGNPSYGGSFSNLGGGGGATPVRITDFYDNDDNNDNDKNNPKPKYNPQHQRILVPDDEELNTVLGGGIMKGSLILLGGDPGVGKSSLLLQTAASVASLATRVPGIGMGPLLPNNNNNNKNNNNNSTEPMMGPVWYVSGEENPQQVASRAARLGIHESELFLLSETHVDTLCEQVISYLMSSSSSSLYDPNQQKQQQQQQQQPQQLPLSLIVIDSIQTMVCSAAGPGAAAGGVTQVRESVALFLRLAKSTGIPIVLIGHVTKSGDVAGPRTVEHMVDCVLYLEGPTSSTTSWDTFGGSSSSSSGSSSGTSGGYTNLRMLRASKNRFGSSDEVGVYEMTAGRLLPVSDPSSLFLAHRNTQEDLEGCAISIAVEGMRAMTVEIQALAVPVGGNNNNNFYGRRTVDGIAYSRLLLLLGVLQKRCGLYFYKQDIFVNVVGRMRLDRAEANAADLAVAVALVSSLSSIPIRSDTAFVGEVGLLGELRSVPALEKRIREARRMGFSRIVGPGGGRRRIRKNNNNNQAAGNKPTVSRVDGVDWIQCDNLMTAINEGLIHPIPKRRKRQSKPAQEDTSKKTIPQSLKDLGMTEIMDDGDDEFDGTENGQYDSFR